MNPTKNITPPQAPQLLAESGGANTAPQQLVQAAPNPPQGNKVGEHLAAPPQQDIGSQASQPNPATQQAQAAAPETNAAATQQESSQQPEAGKVEAKTGVNQNVVKKTTEVVQSFIQFLENTFGKETFHEVLNNCKNMAVEKFGLGQIMNLASNAGGGGLLSKASKMFGFGAAA